MKLKPCPSCVRGCRKCTQTGYAQKQPGYLAFIRTRPCRACAASPPSEAHHEWLEHGEKAFGLRTHDLRALPLCRSCHRRRTDAATRDAFWDQRTAHLGRWMEDQKRSFLEASR